MPTLTRWYVKSALAYFVAALIAAVILAAGSLWPLPEVLRHIRPVYLHMFMFGWVTQLIFGVVYWMFPKYSQEQPRGNENLAWGTFWLLNLGLVVRVIAEPAHSAYPSSIAGVILAASAILQWLAGVVFAYNTWGRVKER